MERAQRAEQQPGLHRAGLRAERRTVVAQRRSELGVADAQGAAESIRVAREVLGRAVHHHVGAEGERPLQRRRRKRAVDDDAHTADLARRRDVRGDVGHAAVRIARRLEPDQVAFAQRGCRVGGGRQRNRLAQRAAGDAPQLSDGEVRAVVAAVDRDARGSRRERTANVAASPELYKTACAACDAVDSTAASAASARSRVGLESRE